MKALKLGVPLLTSLLPTWHQLTFPTNQPTSPHFVCLGSQFQELLSNFGFDLLHFKSINILGLTHV